MCQCNIEMLYIFNIPGFIHLLHFLFYPGFLTVLGKFQVISGPGQIKIKSLSIQVQLGTLRMCNDEPCLL